MKKQTWHLTIMSSTLLSTIAACGGTTAGSGEEKPLISAKGAALHRADDCGDLLAQIQADAVAKLDEVVEEYKTHRYDGYYYGDADGGIDLGGDGAEAGTTGATGTSTGEGAPPTRGDDEAPVAGGDSPDAPSEDPSGHSETNTQVEGVDEADIVKIGEGGKKIYVLHGSELKVLDAWPADATKESGKATVAGSPYELYAHDGMATVFSRVFPADLPDAPEGKNYCYGGGSAYTQISVFDVSGASPTLERELIVEGDYVSSRLHDGTVRAIVRGGFNGHDVFRPRVDIYDSFGREKSDERLAEDLEAWKQNVIVDIKNTTLEDWLPERYERVDDSWVELAPQCDGYFIPEPGLVESGVTQVVSIDPKKNDAPQITAVLGGSDTVYANDTSLYVAQVDYRWEHWARGDGPRTVLHRFGLEEASSSYLGSGFVPGTPLNQFALDEREGILRIATTENDFSTFPKNRIFTLSRENDKLNVLDRSDLLGEEGETIFAVRFLGDRGYVVTFERTDPLYAVDLSDPKDIQILGELHIPGFSEYIHPLGDHHLLTIGQSADENGAQNGVALQIFDVSDATSPKQSAIYSFGGFSSSEAGYNHKAFTYVKDYFDGEDDLLLFPIVTYAPEYRSALEVLRVSEKDGFSHLGSIEHSALINRDCPTFSEFKQPCYYYYGEEMRRGLQIDDFIYALSQGGVTVHDLSALDSGPLTTVEFDRPVIDYSAGCYYGWYGEDFGYGYGGGAAPGAPEGDGGIADTTTGASMGGAASE